MTVLITGAGLVGTLAAKRLVERGERPVLYEVAPQMDNIRRHLDPSTVDLVRGDILDMPDLLRTVRDKKIDRIIHTAGLLTAGVRERPYTGVKVNLLGIMNVLETARLADIKRVVFCSSATVLMRTFGAGATEPYGEDFTLTALSGRPPGVYAALKLACEWIGLDYCDLYGVDFVATRFAGVFGPWKGVPSGLPGRLMSTLVENLALGKPAYLHDPVLTWTGREEMVYARDAAYSTVLACYAEKPKTRIYNISMGKWYDMQELLDIMKRIFPGGIIEVSQRTEGGFGGYPFRRPQPSDISRAREELGFQPEYDNMEKAVRDYAAWVRANVT